MNFYQVISKKQTNDNILIFHEIVNEFWATALDLAKNNKLLSQLIKSAFDISFTDENAKSVSENVSEKNREKTKKNKKKLKIDKKSIKIVDLFEQEHMFKKTVSSSRNYLDDFKLKNWIFKK